MYPTPYVRIKEDSILFSFKDVLKPRAVTCKALGTKVVTDSIVLHTLPGLNFTLFYADTQAIYCVKDPCPPLTHLAGIGSADFSACPVDEPENVLEGSFLCSNLRAKLNLPKRLQGNYSFTYSATFVNKAIVIDFYLRPDRVDWLAKIDAPLKDILNSDNLLQDITLVEMPVIQNIYLDGNLYVIKGYGQPVNRCFEYQADCRKVTLYRRYLEPICSSWNIFTK